MINLIISLDLAHLRNETQSDFCPVRDNRSVATRQARIFFTVPDGTGCVCVNRHFSTHIPSRPGRWGRWCGVFTERLSR
jgi:hypothetical protein